MFSNKKFNISDHLTRNELTVLFFILALTGVGIWYQIYKSTTQSEVAPQALNVDADSLVGKIFTSDVAMESKSSSENRFATSTQSKTNSEKYDKKKPVIVNINTATIEELIKLPGVGLKVAEKIIEYRKLKGRFTSKKELMNIKGIGEKKFEKLENRITLGN